jgi:hypothetical protein
MFMLSELLCVAVVAIGMPNAERACEHMDLVVEVAEERDIEPEVLVALIHVESHWKPTAVSKANACGLTQVVPRYTGRKPTNGVKYLCKQLFEPVLSIRTGGQIFGWWLHNYGKCESKKCKRRHYFIGLCGYNAGFRCRGDNPNQTGVGYAKAVLRKASQIKRALNRRLTREAS